MTQPNVPYNANRAVLVGTVGILLIVGVAVGLVLNYRSDEGRDADIDTLFAQSPCLKAKEDPKAAKLCQRRRDNFARTVTPRQACEIVRTIPRFADLSCANLPNKVTLEAEAERTEARGTTTSAPVSGPQGPSGSPGRPGRPGQSPDPSPSPSPSPQPQPEPSPAPQPEPTPQQQRPVVDAVCGVTSGLGLPVCL